MVSGGRPLPWHDTPFCKALRTEWPSKEEKPCGGPLVPVRAMANGYGGEEGSRIACTACGEGIVGTEEEVAQAERAQRAWEAYERGEIHLDRACAMCGGVLHLDRFRLCATCVEKDNAERQGSLF